MFGIYITASSLANTYLQEGNKSFELQSEWYRILRKQNFIYLSEYNSNDVEYEDEDYLNNKELIDMFSQSAGNIDIKPADDKIQQILLDHSKVLDNPNAAYFLDIDPEEAKAIQDDFGVICQSVNVPVDTSVFTMPCIPINFQKDQVSVKGWDKILQEPAKLPSNSLCIIDRYLFCYEGDTVRGDKKNTIGFDNLQLILLFALPEHYKGIYNVTIIFDGKAIGSGYDVDTLWQELCIRVDNIAKRKGYKINLQYLAIDVDAAGYTKEMTHNRQILSTYYKIQFDNGVNILYYVDGIYAKAKFTQKIQASVTYDNCLHFEEGDPTIMAMEVQRGLIRYCISKWKESSRNSHHYTYRDNNGNKDIKHFNLQSFS